MLYFLALCHEVPCTSRSRIDAGMKSREVQGASILCALMLNHLPLYHKVTDNYYRQLH